MLACFKNIVENLPASYRPVILLSLLEDMKNTEIAEILEIPLETVKIRLHRGRAKLRKELEAHCGFYRDARKNIIWDGRIL
jgi:RNA polymerase sigma-70 factor (ECF subfamily)